MPLYDYKTRIPQSWDIYIESSLWLCIINECRIWSNLLRKKERILLIYIYLVMYWWYIYIYIVIGGKLKVPIETNIVSKWGNN